MEEPKRNATPSELPVLYRRPRALEPQRYAGKSLREMTTFAFARGANSVPVNSVEFVQAMRTYPIVFTPGEPLAALAVLGLRDNENLFVEAGGTWRADCYVPAYVRRYPFIFTEHDNQFILCIDDAADLLVEGGSRPLFADGAPTDIVRRGLAFCGEYQGHYNATRAFVEALVKHDLLVDSQIQFAAEAGRSAALRGFRVVNEAKFNALPDAVFLEWRRLGWIALVYVHLLSLANWARLAALARPPAAR